MKKTIAFLLALVLCLSLAGMGLTAGEEAAEETPAGETVEITAENWEEYFVLAPEYEGKVTGYEIKEIQGSITFKPVPKLDDAEEIIITTDNWSQYFEITEDRQVQEDAFGNVDYVEIEYHINVREAYADYVVPTDSTVAFAVTADGAIEDVAGGYTDYYSVEDTAVYNPAELETNPYANMFGGELHKVEKYNAEGELEVFDHPENITVTRAEGSLFLAGMDPETQRALFEEKTPADAAEPAEEPTAPAGSGPVEITMDNWSQYFEIIERKNEEKNAFGEVETTHIYNVFALKDEYADKLDTEEENAVAVEVSYDWGTKDLGTMNASDDKAVDFSYDCMDVFGYHYGVNVGMAANPSEGLIVENITVTRVQGTIYLKP